ncbi:glycerol kinase [Enterococcus cecorum]|nr:glycerol kinase [Enterococcus cecorum]
MNATSEYRIVVDQSTSATKVLLFDAVDGIQLIKRLDKPHQQIYPKEGFVEHNPLEIVQNTRQLIDDLLILENLLPSDILSISITNQRESIVIWNKNTGNPYSNVMVWQCNRGLDFCNELTLEEKQMVREKTGLRVDPYFSAPKLQWYFDNVEEKHFSELAIGTIDSWLIWNLTEGKYFVTEPSNACRTMLYNIHTKQWDEELCQLFNVPIEALPTVISSKGHFGNYRGIPIISVCADSQAALYAQGMSTDIAAKMTLGTGSSVLVSLQEENADVGSLIKTIVCEHENKMCYAAEGMIKSYGDILNWGMNQLNLYHSYQEASKLAFDEYEDDQEVFFIPALEGLTAPFWLPDVKASFHGLSRKTTQNALVRSLFEAMCFQSRAIIDEYRNNGIEFESIFADGGSIKNEAFMQLLADITQIKIEIREFEELSALGSLLIGIESNYQLKTVKTFIPKRDYNQRYMKWVSIIRG